MSSYKIIGSTEGSDCSLGLQKWWQNNKELTQQLTSTEAPSEPCLSEENATTQLPLLPALLGTQEITVQGLGDQSKQATAAAAITPISHQQGSSRVDSGTLQQRNLRFSQPRLSKKTTKMEQDKGLCLISNF